MISCEKDGPYIGFSHCPVCSAKYATEMGKTIRALETALAAMTKERDDQAEAVRKLARVAAWMKLNMADPRIASACLRRHVDGVEKLVPLVEALNTDWIDAMNNPIARAAVEGER